MATDFAQESRWKRAAAKTVADAVLRHHARIADQKRKEEEEERNRARVLAAVIANQVMSQFWGRVRAVAAIKVHKRPIESGGMVKVGRGNCKFWR